MSLVEIIAFWFNSLFSTFFLDFSTFFYRKTSFLLSTPMDTDCFWQTCSVLSTELLLLCVGSGGSMFFSEQLRKFWSQKRANTSSDGLFSLLYRAKVRTFAASLEAAEAVRKTNKERSIQCTIDVKN